MINYSVDITVDRPTDDVFPYLADITTYPQMDGRHQVPEAISPGPLAPGYRYRYQTDEGEFELEVTDCHARTGVLRPHGDRTDGLDRNLRGRTPMVTRAAGSLSSGSMRLRGIRRLMEPFAGGEVRQREQAELDRLKASSRVGRYVSMARATSGYLVLADISGYTRYLSSSEIERGPAIAADLLEVVVGGLRPVAKLAKLEGDAAFLAGPEADVRASELLDALEGTYAAFRRRIRSLPRQHQLHVRGVQPGR